ncbi:MAG: GGDEF domain-containing protein [Butyrivibrio sp.]|nr:GGDEF domain-containing protein [Butyrivibrio sp.]
MKTIEKPLKRSILIFTIAFIALLCVTLSILAYSTFSSSLYRAYDKRTSDIIEYVEGHIDIEDLTKCIETGVETEKFKEMGLLMDSIMEDFDIHYLYIVKPVLGDAEHGMMNIFSADTAEGRATDPDGYYLNYMMYDVYTEEDLQTYQAALERNTISHFKNFTTWGYDYTAAQPLINDAGEHIALLCVDINVEDVQFAITAHTAITVVLITVMGMVFITVFTMWMSSNVTEPIGQLEKSVGAFAKVSHSKEEKDPNLLNYKAPNIHTKNEVESLSKAITQMAMDMRMYVNNVFEAEGMVEDMKSKVNRMDMIAYQDALTNVKNKAWYDKTQERINENIANNTASFAILMADVNNLKKINDHYGHEHGNDFLLGACRIICRVFNHSPVFRIGGDEFVVLLENIDYRNRDKLVAKLKEEFDKSALDESKEPWERYSAALGLAVYDQYIDTSMNDVFKRADDLMYKNKLESKMARED